MALPTTEHHVSPPQQRATHGMGTQGTQAPLTPMAPPAGTPPPAAAERALDPVLAEGIDPVVLHRLYPEADSIADAASKAVAQGHKTREEGAKLLAAQQEPVP